MANITFEYVLGEDQETYDNLRSALPAGENNLSRGIVVPAHPSNQPLTFKISNLIPDVSYSIDFQGEWQVAPTPRMYFVPINTSQMITVALPYGPVTVAIQDGLYGEVYKFLVSVVNYATFFRAYARDVTEYSKIPLNQIEESIASPIAFRLATPMLAGLTTLIPSDLEILASLAHKLLVKNLLHSPGTIGATSEILAAFSASNPIFFKMQNINKLDSPLFRSEEVFQGYEAHVWLPNREVERWKAFIQLLNNLPQLYTLQQITEGEVYVEQGGKLRRHLFDFESPLANSITTGLTYLTDCFLRLFSLNVTVETEHYLAFCQASYILDQLILNALSPSDADPTAIAPWQTFSLSGRFGQQFGITNTHEWYYDSPLVGEVDGINRFYKLRKFPVSTSAVKVFVDGLLKRLYIDYRVSLSGNIISSAYRLLSMPLGPLLVSIELGKPRPFLAPVFSSFECRGGANLQMLLTGVEQGLDRAAFVISHPPQTAQTDPEAIAIHFVTPIEANTGNPGDNQYGQIALPAGISSYALTYTLPTVSIDYQLLISLTVDPMPSGDPSLVDQVVHIVREHTLTGASIEFSDPLPANTYLNWWVIENDSLTLERGTLLLTDGMSSIPIIFANGPYFDQVVVILQLWEINPTFTDAGQYLVSCSTVGPGGTIAKFSHVIKGTGYRLDYAVFPARGGDFIEFFEPPFGLIEAHYDAKWPHWINAELTPAPDGIRTEFSLPYPVSDPNSVYLALDGRLMTQGANRQYTVQTETVNFTFPPTPNQKLWSVYPVSPTNILPSSWSQGFLNYLPANQGEFATGWIETASSIPNGTTASVWQLPFEAVSTSRGSIISGNIISVGSSVTFGTLGITLTGSPTPNLSYFVTGKCTLGSPIIESVSPSTLGLAIGQALVGPNIPDNTFILSIDSLIQFTMTNDATDSDVDIDITAYYFDQFKVGVSKDDDTASLIDAINNHSVLNLYYIASSPASGFIDVKAKQLGNGFYNESLTATGSLTALDIVGDTAPNSYVSRTIYQGEHVVSLPSSNVDPILNTFHHAFHPFYEGLGVKLTTTAEGSFSVLDYSLASLMAITVNGTILTEGTDWIAEIDNATTASNLASAINTAFVGVTALPVSFVIDLMANTPGIAGNSITLATSNSLAINCSGSTLTAVYPSPLLENTIYYVTNPTAISFQLALIPYGSPIDITTSGSGYYTFISQDVEVATSTFAFPSTSITCTGNTIIDSPVITNILPSTSGLKIGMTVTGTNIPANAIISNIDSLVQITLNTNATGTASSVSFTSEEIFLNNEPVTFTTNGSLPTGLTVGQKYYAINITENRFQVSDEIDGSPVVFTDVGIGELKIHSIPRFASNINQSLDTISLASEIQRHPITGEMVITFVTDNVITITAKEIGIRNNIPITVSDPSILTCHGLLSGRDSMPSPVYASGNICYYYDAPVTTLDGLSTRLWKQYEGDKFLFTYAPSLKQESYYISEIYPVDHHPLDSTVANLPCNYPKGVFTQGFGTHFNETDVSAAIKEGTLVISTANLPVQERPSGIINGINTVFTITLTSCAGQDSLMIWLDGIFQPSDKYTYTDMGSYGQITFLSAPAVGQELWCWYIPYGTACVYERVNALVGAIDGSNQTFDVPDSPWSNPMCLVTFLEGLFILQNQDYTVITGNTQIQFTGTLSPTVGQSLWSHYNLGSVVPIDNWRQIYIGLTDGTSDTYMISHILTSELPTSTDSVLVFLDGLNQGGHFSVEVDSFGNPTGNVIFTDGPPESGRRLEVVYIRK